MRALDVANYVVTYSLRENNPITHLHLQKILYYLEATFLFNGVSLFDEKIEKWKLGPVVPDVYHEYKGFGYRPITFVPNESFFNIETFTIESKTFDEDNFDSYIKVQLDPLINNLLINDGLFWVDETHKHELWYSDEERIMSGEKGIIYDKEEMRDFFQTNPGYLKEFDLIDG